MHRDGGARGRGPRDGRAGGERQTGTWQHPGKASALISPCRLPPRLQGRTAQSCASPHTLTAALLL